MDRAFRELRHLGKLRQPGRGKTFAIRFKPMALHHHIQGNLVLLHRPDQADAALDLAVVEHDARGRNLHCGPSRPLVDQQDSMIGKTSKSVIQTNRMVALALRDAEQPCLGACARMDIDRPPAANDKAFGTERFQPEVVGARRDSALDPSGQQLLEGGKQDIL